MSILFATPCYGGQATTPYYQSCMNLKEALQEIGIKHDWLICWNESLIQRARNNIVKTFLKTDYQKLMFIDADIEFTPEDVSKLWNMNEDIAVGVYPMKKLSAPYAAWVNGKIVRDLDDWDKPTPVDFAGTGFMMIDRPVLEKFKQAYPEKIHDEGNEDGTLEESLAWFDPRVDTETRTYLPEDYAFCKDARNLGYEVIMDPSVKLIHHGNFAFDGTPYNLDNF